MRISLCTAFSCSTMHAYIQSAMPYQLLLGHLTSRCGYQLQQQNYISIIKQCDMHTAPQMQAINMATNVHNINNFFIFLATVINILTLWTPDVFSQTSPWRQTFFRKLPPGARRFFESEKRRDPSRAFIPLTK